MSNFLQSMRQGFGRQTNRGNVSPQLQRPNDSPNTSTTSSSHAGSPLASSPSYTQLGGNGNNTNQPVEAQPDPESPKFFFQSRFSRLGVRGNFMPLAAQPKNVDLGEWLAHQAHEQWRVVDHIVQCVLEVDANTGLPVCNPKTCPTMSAGRSHTYTWLNSRKEPTKVTAAQYFDLVRRWINGKLLDEKAYPIAPLSNASSTFASNGTNTPGGNTPIAMGPTTLNVSMSQLAGHDWVGKAVGFPESFFNDLRSLMRQIFRLYAHIYHAHWVEPFWHLTIGSSGSSWTDLNSCFVHFVTVVKLFGLLTVKDLEPMQPLIDIWISNGSIPPDAATGACTIAPAA